MHAMTRLLTVLITLAILIPGVAGGVQVSIRTDHSTYLRFEPLHVYVTLRNNTDRVYIIDTMNARRPDRLELLVERRRDEPIVRSNKKPLVTWLSLRPDEKQELMFDVAQLYGLYEAGPVRLRAVVYRDGNAVYSNPLSLDIVPGIPAASVRRVVPGYTDMFRIYTLRYWTRNREESLFLSINDEDGRNFGVFDLGRVVRVVRPRIDVDTSGNVTVFHQSGAQLFTRTTFVGERDRVRFVDRTYHREDGRRVEFGAQPEAPDGDE